MTNSDIGLFMVKENQWVTVTLVCLWWMKIN